MTPEQKAKAYDKVREKIALRFGSNVAEEVFSEFEKSKDERIRSIIRGWIYTRPSSFFDNGISKEDILAWLKKEFEDEKVRRALIDYFEDAHKADENPLQSYGIHTDIAIAWLEKRAPQVYETNDDEGWREKIMALINAHGQGMYKDGMLAWLEKQGKQEEPQVYDTEDGEVITYSENIRLLKQL